MLWLKRAIPSGLRLYWEIDQIVIEKMGKVKSSPVLLYDIFGSIMLHGNHCIDKESGQEKVSPTKLVRQMRP